jgi:putative ABC transport system ATP-binding protein
MPSPACAANTSGSSSNSSTCSTASACWRTSRCRRSWPAAVAAKLTRALLDLLGLGDKFDSSPQSLSGGQRQRAAIARALANKPTLLLADEPTGALDSAGKLEVLELFRRLHAGGQAILLVTHDEEVAEAAVRVVRMRDGRVDEGDGTGGSAEAVADRSSVRL